jgi:hypothetical protein
LALSRGYQSDTGLPQRNKSFPVTAASTWNLGDILTFDSSGRLQQLIAVATVYTTQVFAGMANENALSDNGKVKPYASISMWLPNVEWVLPLWSATPANAVFNPNMIGNKYGLRNDANGFPEVNFDDTSNTQVVVVGVLEEDYPGWPTYNGAGTTQYPKILVTPLAAHCFLSGAVS